jgi:transcriptional regulator with XRE-family HTH domain
MPGRITDLGPQAAALRAARKRMGWSQGRLASALEQAADALNRGKDLPPGGRQTLIQYISYFENGRRHVAGRLQLLFCEALKSTAEELGFDDSVSNFAVTELPELPAAHLASAGPAVISSLRLILETNIQADAQIGPAYLIPQCRVICQS